ncbi:hypothetical protein WL68_30000 [Burkholderia cepacia]|nr:hypothetical protein WL06_06795 [Burkholderia cepacia]KWD56854.1 hypothetical protein WL68_30000 [Burkholderia cepacia]KWD73897.1 hypothetical protein WL69_30220 [Burkholderia cepacia]
MAVADDNDGITIFNGDAFPIFQCLCSYFTFLLFFKKSNHSITCLMRELVYIVEIEPFSAQLF